jgi:hypothetical protein
MKFCFSYADVQRPGRLTFSNEWNEYFCVHVECDGRRIKMICKRKLGPVFILAFMTTVIFVIPGVPQADAPMGKLRIKVSPKQAFVFIDGKPMRDGRQTISLLGGQHEVTVENYGYLPRMEQVQIAAGKTTPLEVALQKSGDVVSGPFGDIEFKGHPRAAVFLNGTTPPFFVGHVDEFDNNFIWHQWLLVKPGTYQASVVEQEKTVWSGPITVSAGRRVIVDLNHDGKMREKQFNAGNTLGPQPRFQSGIASARVPIAPVSAQLSASPTQTNGGQSAALNWKTTDAAETTISNVGSVPANGDRTVSPCQTTTYQLVAKGPGGEASPSATINVNSQPAATLSLSQPQVTYHKVGDKLVEQGTTTLNWTSSNADSVTIAPIGGVAASGSQNIQATPGDTSSGPINRDVTYRLQATNSCGGTVTQTAVLHIAGSMDPAPALPPPSIKLASIFYPSNYPDKKHKDVGLLTSEKNTLNKAAAEFNQHEQFPGVQPSELLIVGHADTRGPKDFNLALTQRRVDLVKQYLISQGVPADKLRGQAEGQTHQLDQKQVESLQADNPQKPTKWMTANAKARTATWMAYNRRVDIILQPSGQQSSAAYPNESPDARVLWQRAQPSVGALSGTAAKTKAKSARRILKQPNLSAKAR